MVIRWNQWFRHNWPALLVIALAAAIQLFLVTRPLPFLLTNVVPDDAFYYFDIARSIILGHGSTFNGIDLTNGYHPLWLIVLLPIFKLWYTAAANLAPIRIALLVSVALNTATGFIVLRILSRFTSDRWITGLGMIIWALDPFLIYEDISGLETPLALFFFALLFLSALRLEEGRSTRYWLAGLIGGLMVLARVDYIFYLAAFLAFVLCFRGFRKAFQTSLIAAIPVVPWLAWNLVGFHMLLTSSGNAEALVNHELIVQDHGASFAQFLKAMIYNVQYALADFMQRTGMLSIASALIGAWCVLAATGGIAIPRRFRDIPATLWLFGGFIALFIADAGIRWTDRSWYFVSFGMFLAILSVCVVERVAPRIASRRTLIALLACLVLFSFYVDWSKDLRDAMSGQVEPYEATLWMNANLPAGSKIGVFNAGIQEYFSTQDVVNLDGLVNDDSYAALRAGALWQYVVDDHIAYIADFDEYLDYRYVSFWGIPDVFDNLSLVYTVEDATTTSRSSNGVNIYKVQ